MRLKSDFPAQCRYRSVLLPRFHPKQRLNVINGIRLVNDGLDSPENRFLLLWKKWTNDSACRWTWLANELLRSDSLQFSTIIKFYQRYKLQVDYATAWSYRRYLNYWLSLFVACSARLWHWISQRTFLLSFLSLSLRLASHCKAGLFVTWFTKRSV